MKTPLLAIMAALLFTAQLQAQVWDFQPSEAVPASGPPPVVVHRGPIGSSPYTQPSAPAPVVVSRSSSPRKTANGTYWTWSPAGQAHHRAAVQVRMSNGAGGSGVVVSQDGVEGVLTCEHVTQGGTATITFADGSQARGTSTVDKFGKDVSFVSVTVPASIPKLKVATRDPAPGEKVEFVTYGGPAQRTLRHFYGEATGTPGTFNACCMNGDSGAPILNLRHEVVGIQSYGVNTVATSREGWPIYHPSGSAPCTPIRSFMGRVVARFSRNFVQPHLAGGSSRGGGGPQLYPPSSPPSPGPQAVQSCPGGVCPTPPTQPPVIPPVAPPTPPVSPPEPPKVTLDYDKLAQVIVDRYGDRLRGPQGPPGQNGQDGGPGPPGTPGQPGQDAQVDLDSLAGKVQDRLPPIQVVFQGEGRREMNRQEVRLGGQLQVPPVRVDVRHPGGELYYQEQVLGEPITLELVPVARQGQNR